MRPDAETSSTPAHFIVRPAAQRGTTSLDWLESAHSFSFGDYFDPDYVGYGPLRVINDDLVAAKRGFGRHAHRDMEIVTYILSGTLAHQDSIGNSALIKEGEVQRMSAGTGIEHSEVNPSADAPVHLLQIWIQPAERGLTPSYQQKIFSSEKKAGRFCLIASPEDNVGDSDDGALHIHQNARVYASVLKPKQKIAMPMNPDHGVWVQIARGELTVNGVRLRTGDGAAIEKITQLELVGGSESEVLVFDLGATSDW